MRFSIQRETFLKPLRAVAGVVERRHSHTLPVLSHVLIHVENGRFTLTTTDQEVELIAEGKIEEESSTTGRITVPFRKLMDICRALPDTGLLEVNQENEKIIIRAGRSRFTLSTLPERDFPSLDGHIGDFRLPISKRALRQLIDSTCFAMAEQDVRYYLNGMLLEIKEKSLHAVAADGHRLALNTLSIPTLDEKGLRIIVPRKGVLELLRILDEGEEEVILIIGKNHLRAITGNLTLTTKLLEGKFPEYERIIPRGGDKVVTAERGALKEAFQRAAALFSDKFRGVRLRLTESSLKILATNTEQDEVEEDLEVDYQGGELEIGFNVKYLIDFLNVIQTPTVRLTFSDANSGAKVEGIGEDEAIYVIMPMRI
jgi:DNA polymerase-3 subunit beta